MRFRYAVFVDASYLIQAGGWATFGSWKRADAVPRVADLIAWLQEETGKEAGDRELLRIYWYDGAPRKEATPEQREVAAQPDTKLRLGSLNPWGQQKGVDALLLADMMDLAVNRSVDLAFLVSGDEDLVEAVTRTQAAGIRVHLWGVETPKNTVSAELRREADRFRMLTAAELKRFFDDTRPTEPMLRRAPLPPASAVRPKWVALAPGATEEIAAESLGVTFNGAPPVTYAEVNPEDAAEAGRSFARTWMRSAPPGEIEQVRAQRPNIPYQVDARLLTTSCHQLSVNPDDQLDYDARIALRNGFWEEIDRAGTGG